MIIKLKYLILNLILLSTTIFAVEPVINRGLLDLSDYDFVLDGTLKMQGDVLFYPDKFYTTIPAIMEEQTINLPGFLNDQPNINGNGKGFYTLCFRVITSPKHEQLAISVPEVLSAYKLYIDGKLVIANGTVGVSANSEKPSWKPRVIVFTPNDNNFNICMQVSNFNYKFGGSWEPIKIGLPQEIQRDVRYRLATGMILFGSILMMGLYHLGLYLARRKDRSTLYFAFICLAIAVRTLVIDELYLTELFSVSWEVLVKINFITIAIFPPLLLKYFHFVYPKYSVEWFIKGSIVAAIVFSVIIIFSPAVVHSEFLTPYYHIILGINALYLVVTNFMAFSANLNGSRIVIFGLLILVGAVTNDILVVNSILEGEQLFPLALFIFIFAQSYMLARRFSSSFDQVENLSYDLKELNSQLESKVEERTKELKKVNNELIRALEEVKTLNYLLPICSGCKKIRDDKGYWNEVEEYISKHTDAQFSHSLCPGCIEKLYPQFKNKILGSDK